MDDDAPQRDDPDRHRARAARGLRPRQPPRAARGARRAHRGAGPAPAGAVADLPAGPGQARGLRGEGVVPRLAGGRTRAEVGVPEAAEDSWVLADDDTIASVSAALPARPGPRPTRTPRRTGSTTSRGTTGAGRSRCAGSTCTWSRSWPGTPATATSCASRSSPPTRALLEPRGAGLEQHLEAGLVEDRDAELLGLVGLGAGAVADHDVVGLLRHRRGRLAAAARGSPPWRRRG